MPVPISRNSRGLAAAKVATPSIDMAAVRRPVTVGPSRMKSVSPVSASNAITGRGWSGKPRGPLQRAHADQLVDREVRRGRGHRQQNAAFIERHDEALGTRYAPLRV